MSKEQIPAGQNTEKSEADLGKLNNELESLEQEQAGLKEQKIKERGDLFQQAEQYGQLIIRSQKILDRLRGGDASDPQIKEQIEKAQSFLDNVKNQQRQAIEKIEAIEKIPSVGQTLDKEAEQREFDLAKGWVLEVKKRHDGIIQAVKEEFEDLKQKTKEDFEKIKAELNDSQFQNEIKEKKAQIERYSKSGLFKKPNPDEAESLLTQLLQQKNKYKERAWAWVDKAQELHYGNDPIYRLNENEIKKYGDKGRLSKIFTNLDYTRNFFRKDSQGNFIVEGGKYVYRGGKWTEKKFEQDIKEFNQETKKAMADLLQEIIDYRQEVGKEGSEMNRFIEGKILADKEYDNMSSKINRE